MPRMVPQPHLFAKSSPQPQVPPSLIGRMQRESGNIKDWMGDYCAWEIIQQNRQHSLVFVHDYMDLSDMVAACANYRSTEGSGTNETYSVSTLVRAEIVRAGQGPFSDEDLSAYLSENMVARWFVGISLFGPVPSDTTLQRFSAWVRENHPSDFFQTVRNEIQDHDFEDPATTPYATDTAGMYPCAAPQAPAVILMRFIALVLDLWTLLVPHGDLVLPPDIDSAKLRTGREARNKAAKLRQLGYTVDTARRVCDAITPHLDLLSRSQREDMERYMGYIEKVIADETTTDADGTIIERPHNQRGSYRLITTHDVDATFRKHGSTSILGYNIGIIASPRYIVAAVAMTGATPDHETLPPLLEQMEAHGIPFPENLVGDQAYGQGKTRAQVAAITHGATQLVAKTPTAGGRDPNRYAPADFTVRWNAPHNPILCRCPAGRESTTVFEKPSAEGKTFHFTAKDCAACPLWTECREKNASPTGNRSVFISKYHSFVQNAARFNATDEGKALLKGRWHIEPTIAWITRYDGCRKARCTGQTAAQ